MSETDSGSIDHFDEVSQALSDSLRRPARAAGDIVGEYEIVKQLGEGGFGTVYEAIHTVIERRAAIKILSGSFADARSAAARFVDEARVVNRIHHPNVVDVFDLGELDDGSLYLVMELLEGEELAKRLATRGPIEPAAICEIFGPLSAALEAAHHKGVVHRDLKPENVFLATGATGELVPKLLDFGVAKLLGDTTEGAQHHTRTGIPIGTPHYMSPEQCLALEVDHRSDVYAFGVLCFECLTGKVPFDGAAYVTIANQHTTAPRPRVSKVRRDLGTAFDETVAALMAVDPNDRPSTATDAFRMFAAACEVWCAQGEETTSRRIAKTLRALPTHEELMASQPTQPWIKTEGLPNRPRVPSARSVLATPIGSRPDAGIDDSDVETRVATNAATLPALASDDVDPIVSMKPPWGRYAVVAAVLGLLLAALASRL